MQRLVDDAISHACQVKWTPGAKVQIQAMDANSRTVETAYLLDKIYNSEDKSFNKRLTSVYLRKGIYLKVVRFLDQVSIYFDDETTSTNKNDALERMQTFMGSEQEYSAFLRWMVLDDENLELLLRSSIP
ncbi:MAG: hypothetical protein ABI575_03660 [Oxalobacteraceae bacterium]